MDPDGSKHIGTTWGGVIARVKAYRKRQGKSTETVRDEVIAQGCHRSPSICSEESDAVKEQTRYISLKGRVLLWLTSLRQWKEKHPPRFVGDALHAARSDVCIRCSRNTGMPEGCGSCRAALKALASDIIGSRKSDDRLAGCIVTGEHLPVATWLDSVAIANSELPGECWRKRTL